MSEQLHSALKRLFDRHRIVFCYDSARELKRDFEAIALEYNDYRAAIPTRTNLE